ncbi:Hypothetical protein D9617_20g026880 [Elsinoe fawcettii]|nr:Hypothetical protein D9617_20g026880 [Elsinoe fawcettii]
MSLFGGHSSASHTPSASPSVSPILPPIEPGRHPDENVAVTDPQNEEEGLSGLETSLPSSEDDEHRDSEPKGDSAEQGRARFPGSDNLWRYYASDAIALSRALDDERANDLSSHLFNTHAWKQALRDPHLHGPEVSLMRKSKWIKEQDDGRKPWYTAAQWTAWPLDPEKVPRSESSFWGIRGGFLETSGETFVEEMRAAGLRQVKEQWTKREPERRRRDQFATSLDRNRSRSRSRTRSVTPIGSDQPDEGSSGWSDDGSEVAPPVLSANVDETDALLAPIVYSIQSQVDTLLAALQHSRSGLHANGRDEDSRRLRASWSRSRSKSRSTSRRRRSGNATSASAAEDPATEDPAMREPATEDEERSGRPRKRQKTNSGSDVSGTRSASATSASSLNSDHAKAPRDWSEVLGVAAICGWDAKVVKRAQSRCEALFGERMMFHTLLEDPNDQGDHDRRDTEDDDTVTPYVQLLEEPVQGYNCPFENCKRHGRLFPFSQGYRFREHLSRSHRLNAEQIEPLVEAASASRGTVPTSQKNPRGWIPPEPLSCPHTDCPTRTKIYGEPRRLIDHFKRYHKYDPRTGSPPPSRAQSTDGDTSDGDTTSGGVTMEKDFMVGGVHNDGFLVPIGSRMVRRKAKKMEDRTGKDDVD